MACALGAAGIALLVPRPAAGLDAVGVAADLAGALGTACGLVLTEHWGRPEGIGLLTFTGWQLTVGGLLLAPTMLLAGGLPATLTTENLGGFAYLGVIGALLSCPIWFRGAERLPPLVLQRCFPDGWAGSGGVWPRRW